eukprot:EG_transcript_15916
MCRAMEARASQALRGACLPPILGNEAWSKALFSPLLLPVLLCSACVSPMLPAPHPTAPPHPVPGMGRCSPMSFRHFVHTAARRAAVFPTAHSSAPGFPAAWFAELPFCFPYN